MEPHFFVGTVVSNEDPYKRGRIQIRIKGIHTDETDKKEDEGMGIPDEECPWATTIGDLKYSGTLPPPKIPEKAWVFGCSLDGDAYQELLVLGRLSLDVDQNAKYEGTALSCEESFNAASASTSSTSTSSSSSNSENSESSNSESNSESSSSDSSGTSSSSTSESSSSTTNSSSSSTTTTSESSTQNTNYSGSSTSINANTTTTTTTTSSSSYSGGYENNWLQRVYNTASTVNQIANTLSNVQEHFFSTTNQTGSTTTTYDTAISQVQNYQKALEFAQYSISYSDGTFMMLPQDVIDAFKYMSELDAYKKKYKEILENAGIVLNSGVTIDEACKDSNINELLAKTYYEYLLDLCQDPVLAAASFNSGYGTVMTGYEESGKHVSSIIEICGDPRIMDISYTEWVERIKRQIDDSTLPSYLEKFINCIGEEYLPGGQKCPEQYNTKVITTQEYTTSFTNNLYTLNNYYYTNSNQYTQELSLLIPSYEHSNFSIDLEEINESEKSIIKKANANSYNNISNEIKSKYITFLHQLESSLDTYITAFNKDVSKLTNKELQLMVDYYKSKSSNSIFNNLSNYTTSTDLFSDIKTSLDSLLEEAEDVFNKLSNTTIQ